MLLNFKSGLPLGAVDTAKSAVVAHMESKQHAPKKRVMCVSGAIQTQFFIIYITCIINFYIEKYILALGVAASCLFNLWKVKRASGVA